MANRKPPRRRPLKRSNHSVKGKAQAKALALTDGNPSHGGAPQTGVLVTGRNGSAHAYQATPTKAAMTTTISTAGSYFGVFGLRFIPTPYNPDSLVQKHGIKKYREMALDEQIKAALFAKKYAVLSTGFEVQVAATPEGEEDETLQEHKDFIEFNFDEMRGSFEGKLLDILSALTYGHSVSEKILYTIDGGPFDGLWGLKDLKTRPPDDIQFATDAFGDLLDDGIWQNYIHMPTWKFVVYTHNGTFGNWYGESDLRNSYRPWWCKDSMIKLMAVALERYGEPIAVATVKGVIDPEQRSDLEAFLKNLQSRSGIILPDNVTLDFKAPPPRAAEAFIPALNYYDQLIRMSILMPGLIGLSGEQQQGSFARAVKEFDVFLWVLNQLRRDLETCINEQVVKPLIDLNYEVDHGQYPRFRFKEVTEEARQKQFELFLMGLSGGALNKGPEDENKLRDLINFEPLPADFLPPQPMDLASMLGGGGGAPGAGPGGMNGNAGGGSTTEKLPTPPTQPKGQAELNKLSQREYALDLSDEQALLALVDELRNVQ